MIEKFPYDIIDLTHTVDTNTPTWEGSCGFKVDVLLDYKDCQEDVKFLVHKLSMNAGIGTHIDAPAHCFPGGLLVADLPLNDLIAPCFCIDVSDKMHEAYQVTAEDVLDFEKKHATHIQNSFVIFYTGWSKYWNNPSLYRNNYQFPSVSAEAIRLLLDRNIVGIGIDTLGPDVPKNNFVVHKLMLGAGKYIVENIANAENLPPVHSYVMSIPIKLAGVTEAPIRLVGLIKNT